MKRILIIPQIKIHNANALSSPYTIGFPAMTAWLGGVHALQRQLNKNGFESVQFISTAVVCHEITMRTHKSKADYIHSIVGMGSPLDKYGKRSAFIEEGKCHLTVSLAVEYKGIDKENEELFREALYFHLHTTIKLAGGDILSFNEPEMLKISDEKDLQKLTRKLMPGYVILERRDLMVEAMKNGQDAIDALLDHLKIMHRSEKDDMGKIKWSSQRKTMGWIIPISTGFHGISPLGIAINQRDMTTPHRFAESVVTLGEFKMVYRIKNMDDMLWHAHADNENNLYLCQQNNKSLT